MITRKLLEQKIAEYQAGKDKAIADANAFEGAIQALLQLMMMLETPQESEQEKVIE